MWYSATPFRMLWEDGIGDRGNYTGEIDATHQQQERHQRGYVEHQDVAEHVPLRTLSMGKGMTIGGMVIAGLIFILFTLDLLTGIPFRKASVAMDVAFLVCSLGLAFLSWSTLKDFD